MSVKWFLILVKIIVLLAGVLWFLQNPGVVSITWDTYQIDMSLGMALCLFFGVLFLIFLTTHFIRKTRRFFAESELTRSKRLQYGIEKLEKSFILKESNTLAPALDLAKEAENYLPNFAFPKLLIKHLRHDLNGVDLSYSDLNHLKECTPLFEKEKIEALQQTQDWKSLAKLFETLHPKFSHEAWFWRAYFFFKYESCDLEKAKDILDNCERLDAFSPTELKDVTSNLYHKFSMQKDVGWEKQKNYFELAFQANPANLKNTLAYATALFAQKEKNTAKRVLKKAWKESPQWGLAELYASKFADSTLDRSHLIRELHDMMTKDPVSHACLAISLIQSKLWGEATRVIDKIQDTPLQEFLRTMLVLKEKETDQVPLSLLLRFSKTIPDLETYASAFELKG